MRPGPRPSIRPGQAGAPAIPHQRGTACLWSYEHQLLHRPSDLCPKRKRNHNTGPKKTTWQQGPKSPAGATLSGARGTPGPGTKGCPQGSPGRGHETLLGREARSPTQALPHGLAPRTRRRGPLGTVGAWQQQGCPCQGMLLATFPGAGGIPKPHPPRMEALPCSLPPATPQPRASRGTSRVLPRAPGPCTLCEGQCPGRRPPEAAPGARHTCERVGGPRRPEQGRWGGGEAGSSGGSPGSWLSWLPSAPPGEAVVRLRVAVVTLAGNQHLLCLETGPESALWESGTSGPGGEPVRPPFVAPDPDLASVSPWQGAPSAEGPQTLTRPRCPCGKGRRAWRGPKPRLGLSVSTARGAERGGAPNPDSASVSPW